MWRLALSQPPTCLLPTAYSLLGTSVLTTHLNTAIVIVLQLLCITSLSEGVEKYTKSDLTLDLPLTYYLYSLRLLGAYQTLEDCYAH